MFKKSRRRRSYDRFEVLSSKSSFTYSEAFKSLRTNVEFVASTENLKTLMMVSTLAGEGKTTVSINLAIALAQNGKKVLLVDCDLRRPKVQRYLRIKSTSQQGVSTVLSGTSDLDNSIGYIEELGIYVMLSGPIPPNPSELLASERTEKFIEELEKRFDYIICDTPPVFVVADALALSKNVDGAILIVRQDFASKNQINEAMDKLNAVDAKIIGTVLNHYNSKIDSGYKYDKYYNYNHYYEYYQR